MSILRPMALPSSLTPLRASCRSTSARATCRAAHRTGSRARTRRARHAAGGGRRLRQAAMAVATEGANRIMIYGPKEDGTYVVEFKTAAREALAISIPRTETAVIRHFQERMPHGLFVPDVPVRNLWRAHVFPQRSSRNCPTAAVGHDGHDDPSRSARHGCLVNHPIFRFLNGRASAGCWPPG